MQNDHTKIRNDAEDTIIGTCSICGGPIVA